jgi:epoxyqueuosine reductase QueG
VEERVKNIEEQMTKFYTNSIFVIVINTNTIIKIIIVFVVIKNNFFFFYIKLLYKRYEGGLSTLRETRDAIAKMQEELKTLEPRLLQQAHEIKELMDKVAQDQERTEEVKKMVAEEEAFVRDEASKAKV